MPAVTVLVVDDDPVIVQLLRVNFELEGYKVATAGNGEEALTAVKKKRPDIVVSDIMMPKMDGLQFVKELQADAKLAGLPVILLSAKAQSADVTRGIELGAADYVTKPFDPLELIERVTAVLAKSR
ncbi:MAG: response regulator with CheY-like receiver domain and winged-helix DNA-binding domain [Acidimicrobiales bacterium]|jgi:DNA-binding response OmpR family regulator|nr:response regulator with CheY-like receiver domain and winged-helix DNA-binding domain [Acidimicrobiales bacterium]